MARPVKFACRAPRSRPPCPAMQPHMICVLRASFPELERPGAALAHQRAANRVPGRQ
jgi:hypothetical protein